MRLPVRIKRTLRLQTQWCEAVRRKAPSLDIPNPYEALEKHGEWTYALIKVCGWRQMISAYISHNCKIRYFVSTPSSEI